jgi:hypothetical protein
MTQRKTNHLLLLVIGASLSIATSVVYADPNSADLSATGTPRPKASMAVAFAGDRTRSVSATSARQSRTSTVAPSASSPLEARPAIVEPRECDRHHGIDSDCVFN